MKGLVETTQTKTISTELPSISIVIPTYNSERVLTQCLESIVKQDYPRDKIEIIIVDGGSNDGTIEIARGYEVHKILHNPLRTGESGKAVGVRASKNDLVALIDSDNILPSSNWLRTMVEPFNDQETVGAEPNCFTYRKKDPLISRYCALLGMNDVLCFYLGNYDRQNYSTGKWTELPLDVTDNGGYLVIDLDKTNIPTMGANGFLVRKKVLKQVEYYPYLFDVDVVHQLVMKSWSRFAKVKIGIVHLFASDLKTFFEKTYRRIRDYLYYEKHGKRKYAWKKKRIKVIIFVLFALTTLPTAPDMIRGYKRIPDKAWFFHPIACFLTFFIYASQYVLNFTQHLRLKQ